MTEGYYKEKRVSTSKIAGVGTCRHSGHSVFWSAGLYNRYKLVTLKLQFIPEVGFNNLENFFITI